MVQSLLNESIVLACDVIRCNESSDTFTGVSKELLMRWGVEIDPNTLTKDELYKLLQRHSGGARIKQYQELVIDYGIAPEKLRSLSESKVSARCCISIPSDLQATVQACAVQAHIANKMVRRGTCGGAQASESAKN